MSDLISRSALIEELKNIEVKIDYEALKKLADCTKDDSLIDTIIKYVLWQSTEIAMQHIENQPTVEAIPKEKLDEICERLEESKQGAKDSKDLSKYSAYEQSINIVKGVINANN